jgi:hypothetical protein
MTVQVPSHFLPVKLWRDQMEYLVGASLATATGLFATVTGFDRSRAFYPVVLIAAASYYCLFAVLSGSHAALWQEAVVASLFAVAAVIGFRTNPWLIVAALAGHGLMDLVHHELVSNPGIPSYWPGFCAAFDIVAAFYLALLLGCRRKGDTPDRVLSRAGVHH